MRLSIGALCVVSLLALLIWKPALSKDQRSNTRPPHGLYIFLPEECPADMEDDRLIHVVMLLPNDGTFINGRPIERSALSHEIAAIMATRFEPSVFILGDRNISYGEVMNAVSGMVTESPNLTTILLTESQAGPADPERAKEWWPKYGNGKNPTCLASNSWNWTARGPRTQS